MRMTAPSLQKMIPAGRSTFFWFFGLALLVIGAVALDLHTGDALRYADESDYEQVSRSMLHRGEFADGAGNLTMARPPGYPAVIAAAYAIVERPVAARLLNAVFLLLGVLALARLASRIEPRAAVLVPYLVLGYPLMVYASSLLFPQTFGCLLLTLIVLLVTTERFGPREAILAGLCYGVLILAIPYFLLLLPLFALYVFVSQRNRWRTAMLAALMMAVAAALVVPWTVRNYVQFQAFVPVSANNGNNLFIGNSPVTTPNSGRTADILPYCKGLHPGMTEHEFESTMGDCAVAWIKENPKAAAWLYVGKVINYFNYRNEIATPGESARWRDWLVFATYYPLLLIAAVRLALLRRYPLAPIEMLIYAVYVLNAFASAIFFTRLRFRIPFDFLLIGINAAYLMRWWLGRWNALSRQESPAADA